MTAINIPAIGNMKASALAHDALRSVPHCAHLRKVLGFTSSFSSRLIAGCAHTGHFSPSTTVAQRIRISIWRHGSVPNGRVVSRIQGAVRLDGNVNRDARRILGAWNLDVVPADGFEESVVAPSAEDENALPSRHRDPGRHKAVLNEERTVQRDAQDLVLVREAIPEMGCDVTDDLVLAANGGRERFLLRNLRAGRSEEHTSELQSPYVI